MKRRSCCQADSFGAPASQPDQLLTPCWSCQQAACVQSNFRYRPQRAINPSLQVLLYHRDACEAASEEALVELCDWCSRCIHYLATQVHHQAEQQGGFMMDCCRCGFNTVSCSRAASNRVEECSRGLSTQYREAGSPGGTPAPLGPPASLALECITPPHAACSLPITCASLRVRTTANGSRAGGAAATGGVQGASGGGAVWGRAVRAGDTAVHYRPRPPALPQRADAHRE
jgi:hypothetical protein